ncbi:MAG: HEAT repeat domain-containing protein [bacterium]|nr:HEAT repeat domain-containing protein [bacterium]
MISVVKKNIKVLICLFLFLFWQPWLTIIGHDILAQVSSSEEVERKILRYMQEFLSEDPTGTKQAAAERKIIDEFGLSALPTLLTGLLVDNEKMTYYSLRTITELIYKRIKLEGEKIGKFDVAELSLSQKEKETLERIYKKIPDLLSSPSGRVRAQIAIALSTFGRQDAVRTIEKLLNDPDPEVRYRAFFALKLLGHTQYNFFKVMVGEEPSTPEDYGKFLSYITPWGLEIQAAEELKKQGKKAVPFLIKLASCDKGPARQRAISLLGKMKAEEAIPVFENYLKEETRDETMYSIQYSCIGALFDIDTDKSIRAIEEYGLKHKNPKIRYFTAKTIYQVINPVVSEERGRYPLFDRYSKRLQEEAKRVLVEMLKQVDADKKLEIGILFIRNKEKDGVEILIEMLNEKRCLSVAKDWLEEMTGQNFGQLPQVVSKKMLETYINRWKTWWEKNKDTFQFPENRQ